MNLRFIWVGKTREKNLKALHDEYLKRLGFFAGTEIIEVKEAQAHEGPDIEGNRILQKLNPKSFVCLLGVTGDSLTSHQLAKKIETWQDRGLREICFVIGGADGVSAEVAERADVRLSLSFLTFTHEMARVILLEQLYRGYTIIKGFPYQK